MGSSKVAKPITVLSLSEDSLTSVRASTSAGSLTPAVDRAAVLAEATQFEYYDLVKNWSKIEPHLDDEELNAVLVRDFNIRELGCTGRPFTAGMTPQQLHEEIVQSEEYDPREGDPQPHWKYVKHRACHWIVNFTLRLAKLVEPNREWRILSGDKHSTVWDGERTLFEFNYFTFGITADECYKNASEGDEGIAVGEYIESTSTSPDFAEFFTVENRADWDMKAVAEQAKEYQINFIQSIKQGALANDLDAMIAAMARYQQVKDFLEAMEADDEDKAAVILEQLGTQETGAQVKAINRTNAIVEKQSASLLKKVTKAGNQIVFVSTEAVKTGSGKIEQGFTVKSNGTITNMDEENTNPPKDELLKFLRYALANRWDWILCVKPTTGKRKSKFYSFEHYTCNAFDFSKAVAEPAAAEPKYMKDVVWQNEKYVAELRQRKKQFQYPTQMPMFPTEVAA
jgi:hypothetical protein